MNYKSIVYLAEGMLAILSIGSRKTVLANLTSGIQSAQTTCAHLNIELKLSNRSKIYRITIAMWLYLTHQHKSLTQPLIYNSNICPFPNSYALTNHCRLDAALNNSVSLKKRIKSAYKKLTEQMP